MLRVAVADECPLFILGMTQALTLGGFSVITSGGVIDTEFLAHTDVLLIDAELMATDEQRSFFERAIGACLVIVLATFGPTDDVTHFLSAGAAGVLDRRSSPGTFETVINGVCAGRILIASSLDVESVDVTPHSIVNSLSEREEQVLRYISKGLTHGQVARRLGISPHTVDTYVKRIRAKLSLGNKADLTRAAFQMKLTG